jgi:hypothetical protein
MEAQIESVRGNLMAFKNKPAKAVRACHFSDFTSTPTPGLVIPRVPVVHPNGATSQKNRSWKDIVEHWLVGDPDRGLKTPLKDWPKEWYQGANRRFEGDHRAGVCQPVSQHWYLLCLRHCSPSSGYDSNEAHFLVAYPEAELGHQLLKAVNEARVAREERISRRK